MDDFQLYLDQALSNIEPTSISQNIEYSDYNIEEEIRHLLISTRSTLGITQKQLSLTSGVSQANISKIETGNYNPSIAILKRIADSLGRRLVIDFVVWEDV